MRNFFLYILVGVLPTLCLPVFAKEKLVLTGSSTLAPLVAELAKDFESKHPEALIEVQSGGSAKGIADCRAELNDLGMISRALNPDEKDVQATRVALDGIAFIGHGNLKIQSITKSQLIAIYKGEIRNWKALGGTDQKITVVNKAEGRAALELFLHFSSLKASEIKADLVIGEEEQGIKTVASTQGAIGYVSVISALSADKSGNTKVRVFALDQKKPSVEALRSGKYELSRPLSIISCGNESKLATEFKKYLISSEAQKVIEKLGYIPL